MNYTLTRKSNFRKLAMLCFIAVLQMISSGETAAQTTLAKGDVAVLAWNANSVSGSDQLAFVSWVPLTNNTVIKITNNRWHAGATSGNSLSASAGSTLNQIVNWTNNTGSTIAAGTVIFIQLASTTPTTNVGSVAYNSQSNGGTTFPLTNAGQRLFIYQGSDYTSGAGTDPNTFQGTILYGLLYQGVLGTGAWLVSGTANTNNTYLPSELNTSGYNIVLASNAVGGQYTGSRSSQSSFAAYQALVANSANWTTVVNPNTVTISTTNFTVSTPNYYYDGSGNINSLTEWGTNSDGTGSDPASFTESGSTYFIANTSGTVNMPGNWTVGSATGTLNIASGIVLGINGNTLNVTGAIAGTGTLAGSSTSNLTLTGTVGTLNFTTGAANRTLHDLTLSASTTATLGTAITITGGGSAGTVTVGSSSTLTTGGNLTLASDASGTGRIGNSSGSISGNVTIERYIPGKRAFRFFGHPFSSAIALSQLTDDIDITGSGGATNGFTPTVTNNPSSYWYDVSVANGSASNDLGWTAFTSASTSSWDQYEMARILVRGSLGQGLTGGSYTPSATTIDMSGAVNQGTQVVLVTKGTGSIYAGVANPFPSGIQMNQVTRGAGIATFYYVWNATSGAAGAYEAKLYSGSYILPSSAGYVTALSSSSTLTFPESCKATGGVALFKGTGQEPPQVQLIISDSTTKWDELLISFDDNAMTVAEQLVDASKFYNPGLDFFTLSSDSERLAIDVRPYQDGSSIPLGLTAYNRYNKYMIKAGTFDVLPGTKLYLHDKYLNKKEEVIAGFEYWFDVTTDSLSQGNQRFEINMVGTPTNGIIEAIGKAAKMQLIPNPAETEVKVAFDKLEGNAQVKLISVTGQVLYSSEIKSGSGSVTIPLHNMPGGIYFVELQGKNARFTEKLIKQ